MEKQNLLAGRKKRFNYPIFQILTRKALLNSKTPSRMEDSDLQDLLDTPKSLDRTNKSICQTSRFTQELIKVAEVWEKCLRVKLHSKRNQQFLLKREWLFSINQVVCTTWKVVAVAKETHWCKISIRPNLWSTQVQLIIGKMQVLLVRQVISIIAIMMDLVKLRKNST